VREAALEAALKVSLTRVFLLVTLAALFNRRRTACRRRGAVTKPEVVAEVATKTGMGKAEAERAVNTFLEILTEALKRGEKVNLVGFGVFEVSDRKARTGRNPQTGAEITIPASKNPRFRASKLFKDALK
jgi:DNA-binding protein HU-beta